MLKVTITFTLNEENYNSYEDILDTFSNDMDCLGAENLEVREEEV